MSIRKNCPCDIDGICPYDAVYFHDCEYWCGEDEDDAPFYEDEEIEEVEQCLHQK